MSLRTSHKLAAFTFAALSAAGCSSEDNSADPDASRGQGADQGPVQGAEQGPDQGTNEQGPAQDADQGADQGGAELVACSSVPGNHAAACPAGAPCAITVDREITCDDDWFDNVYGYSFADVSHRVVTTPTASFLGVAGWSFTGLLEVSADAATVLPGFPVVQSHTPLLLAADPAGGVAAVIAEPILNGRLDFVRPNNGGFTKETFDGGLPGALNDLAFDAQGVAYVYYDNSELFRRAVTGGWNHDTLPGFSGGDRFALATDGNTVVFGMGATQLTLEVGVTVKPLGSPVLTPSPTGVRFRPLGAPQPSAGAAPAFGAIIQHADGLRVAWPTATGFEERAIEGSAVPTLSCSLGMDYDTPYAPCRAACEERTTGLEFEAFAGAFGAGGEAWVAYVDSHVDLTVDYALQNFDGYNVCSGNVGRNDSTSELRLVRVPTDGSPAQQVLALPLDKLDRGDRLEKNTDAGPVSVHAFGDALTIGVRVLDAANRPKVRVLRVDTAALRGQLTQPR